MNWALTICNAHNKEHSHGMLSVTLVLSRALGEESLYKKLIATEASTWYFMPVTEMVLLYSTFEKVLLQFNLTPVFPFCKKVKFKRHFLRKVDRKK